MLYATQIRIRNLSPWTFVLNRELSCGLEGGAWPGTITKMTNGESQTFNFEHHWAWQIDLMVRYSRKNVSDEGFSIRLYADGVEVFECSFKAVGFDQQMVGQLECPHSRSLLLVLEQSDDRLKD